MKIAVVGTGISGNLAAYHLNKKHDITVFEAENYAGGHTHTHTVELGGEKQIIDTGFIVFNKKTYPDFINLLKELKVPYQSSKMSFSVQNQRTGLEYNGTNLNALFAQRRNLFRPRFYRMIKQILRFNKESLSLLADDTDSISLGDYLSNNQYGKEFIHDYIIPMGAAIWSTDHDSMFAFPARFFVQFFHNHGMLSVDVRPEWFVIKGGSSEYLKPLIAGHKDKIRLSAPVENVRRTAGGVFVKATGYEEERFDYVFIASHSDQALSSLAEPTPLENEVLGAIPYINNEVVLHYDQSLLPKRKLAWGAWNYHLLKEKKERVALTYNMNILQSLKSDYTFNVTLNNTAAIDPKKIIKVLQYTHPFFSVDGVKAQQKHSELNGQNRTYYCGAYWRYGFHEDGVVSALQALKDFNRDVLGEQ
jgi:predicted NAD/FAD-binding protein